MAETTEPTDLSGKLLIASPGMQDPRFKGSVVFICAHSSDGAMGLIVNMPAPEIPMQDLFDQLEIPLGRTDRNIHVHFGGPVETGRGFVLHSNDYAADDATLSVDESFAMTASVDILRSIANGEGPGEAMLMLGYSGWGPGQLENEIVQNGWLIADASEELVFETIAEAKWKASLKTLGIDPLMLSSVGGRA